jgi:hypothetical protein
MVKELILIALALRFQALCIIDNPDSKKRKYVLLLHPFDLVDCLLFPRIKAKSLEELLLI